MATIRKRGSSWQAKVRRDGHLPYQKRSLQRLTQPRGQGIKNDHPRTIPLTPKAFEILALLERKDHLVFPVTPHAVRLSWERLRRRAGLEDLRLHDLRHEAVSRFFEYGLSVPEVVLISGHRDPRILSRYTYFRPERVMRNWRKRRLVGITAPALDPAQNPCFKPSLAQGNCDQEI